MYALLNKSLSQDQNNELGKTLKTNYLTFVNLTLYQMTTLFLNGWKVKTQKCADQFKLLYGKYNIKIIIFQYYDSNLFCHRCFGHRLATKSNKM